MNERSRIVAGWLEFLTPFSWFHLAHLTFPADCQAVSAFDRIRKWESSLVAASQGPIPWFAVAESKTPSRCHAHLLMAGSERLRTRQMEGNWRCKNGHCRIEVVRSPIRAIRYVVKSLSDSATEFAMSNGFEKRIKGFRRN